MTPQPQRPHVVAHAVWSPHANRRWVAAAARDGGGWRFLHLLGVGREGSIAERMHVADHGLPLLVGVDFAIGVPRWWAHAVGVERFADLLPLLGREAPWKEALSPAAEPAQITLHRPFFPAGRVRAGDGGRLLAALGAQSLDELSRRCEQTVAHERARQPLFLAMGPRQVAKAAISGWRELLIPALRGETGQRPPSLWPFHGRLSRLLGEERTVVAETSPRRFQSELAPTLSSTRRRTSRAKQAQSLLLGAQVAGLELDETITRTVESGYPADAIDGLSREPDGAHPFQAMIGLVGMLLVLARGEEPLPADRDVAELEGWVLGMPSDDAPVVAVEPRAGATVDIQSHSGAGAPASGASDERDDTVRDDVRHVRGLERFRELHGDDGDAVLAPLGDLGRYIVDFGFGDLYSRPGLSVRERQLATISMLVVLGHDAQLSGHIKAGLHVGIEPHEIEEIILQSVAYAGFPPAVNALGVLRAVLEE